jgi:fluoride exporter
MVHSFQDTLPCEEGIRAGLKATVVERIDTSKMTEMLTKILLVMAGGSLGAVGRYMVSLGAMRLFGSGLSWGTFLANMIGCFLIGVIFALVDRVPWLTPSVRLFFMTGFLGALTTFSTYALEVVTAIRGGGFGVAAITFLANNIGGIGLVLAGIGLVQILFKGGATWP